MQILELKVVARDGIEPSTRGFSVRRRGRFGARKPKTGNAFPRERPNRPARPSPYRTEPPNSGRGRTVAHAGQRLSRIATEPFPNRRPNGAALGFGVTPPSLAALRFAPSERTLDGRDRPRAEVRLALKQTLNVRAPREGLGVSANGARLLRDSTQDQRRTRARCNRTHACAMPARVESLRRYQRAARALRPEP